MELVTPMMEMILTTPTLKVMVVMMVVMVVMMVETKEMVEMTMRMTTMPHYLLRGGQWRST